MFDYLIVTHLPAFYKVNLYNEINKKKKVFVIFISENTSEVRGADFSAKDTAEFPYVVINPTEFQLRRKVTSCIKVLYFLRTINYSRLVLGGWDLPEFWVGAFCSKKDRNSLALESTIYESNSSLLMSFVKKLFLSRIGLVFASGNLHVELLQKLNFQKSIKITRGVGLINRSHTNRESNKYEKKFLYVGRLSEVKNLKMVIEVFNSMPSFKLTIVGIGDLFEELKSISAPNIKFLGELKNSELPSVYTQHNFLILPSLSEPWGLVVEEALYNQRPAIVSNRCGSSELIANGVNGFTFDPEKPRYLKKLLGSISCETYQKLISNNLIEQVALKDVNQINAYYD